MTLLRLVVALLLLAAPAVGLSVDVVTGFEAGGSASASVLEFASYTGTPSQSSSAARTGDFGMMLDGGEDGNIALINAVSTQKMIYGFCVRFTTDVTPSVDVPLFQVHDASTGILMGVNIAVGGTLSVVDSLTTDQITGTTVLSIDTWHCVEVYVEHTGTGATELFVDGISEGTDASGDYNTGTNGDEIFIQDPDTVFAASNIMHFDDVYVFHDVTDADDRCSQGALELCEVFWFSGGPASVTPDSGTDLDAGQWDNLRIPHALTLATYSTSSAVSGEVNADDVGSGSCTGGPKECSSINGTVVAGNWLLYAERGNGSGTTHTQLYGNDVDGVSEATVTLDTTAALFRQASNAAGVLPTDQEYCRLGLKKSSGGQQFDAYSHWCYILHRPAADTVPQQLVIQ